jgi:hypothetical protein
VKASKRAVFCSWPCERLKFNVCRLKCRNRFKWTPLIWAIGSAIHVSDLKLPEGVKAVQNAGSVVVSVAQQMAEEVKAVAPTAEGAAAAAAVPGAAAEPEVLTAKKKEEGAVDA